MFAYVNIYIYTREAEPSHRIAERLGQLLLNNSVQLGGIVFADGHASKTCICGLDRASWALVELDLNGNVIAIVRGVVPAEYPQTSQAAEFFAGAYASKFLDRPTMLLDDCANFGAMRYSYMWAS